MWYHVPDTMLSLSCILFNTVTPGDVGAIRCPYSEREMKA